MTPREAALDFELSVIQKLHGNELHEMFLPSRCPGDFFLFFLPFLTDTCANWKRSRLSGTSRFYSDSSDDLHPRYASCE